MSPLIQPSLPKKRDSVCSKIAAIDTWAETATSGEVLIVAVVSFNHHLGSGLVLPKLTQDKAAWT
jgi:hypothetical protein